MVIETLQGSVQRIVYYNEQTGFRVMRVRLPSGPVISITGEFGPDMIVGTIASFHGHYKTHPKYGQNFRVSSYDISHNAEEITSIQLFIDAIAPNIGPERAEMIVIHFGNDLIRVLDEEPDRLTEVEGIGKISAESLKKAWMENRERWNESRQEFTLRAFLNSLGIKERRVKRILGHFGGGLIAESSIRSNPYILAEIEGFGFSIADFVARKLGTSEDAPQRLRALIFYLLEVVCPSNGHLYYTTAELSQLINTYCKEHNTTFLGKQRIETTDIPEFISALQNDDLIMTEEDSLYSRYTFNTESRAASLLGAIINKPSDLIQLNKDAVDRHIKNFEKENNIKLSEEQKQALHYFVEKKVFIITGAPGTGKTLITKALVDLALKLHLSLTCMTPTGISAKKLSDTVKYSASTIHRTLGFRGKEWSYGENDKFETDIAVIDEVSMIDQDVLYHLLAALRDRTHLVFVGDDNQLPSVGAGNVLRELINCGDIPVVRLETIFRQEETSDIIKVAHKIKNGDTDLSLFKSDPMADVFFIRMTKPEDIEGLIVKLAQKFKNERRLFQIITPRREGPASVSVLNKILQEVLNPPAEGLDELICNDYVLRKGDRIIVKKNDYENMIFNGDIGKIVRIGNGSLSVIIDDREITLGIEDLEDRIRLAYTITCHNAQGLEYPIIILPFINHFGKMLLQRNLLYTAITRAKQKVIVIGHSSAIEKAINNSSVYRRNTRLGERLCRSLRMMRNDASETWPEQQQAFQSVRQEKGPSSSSMEDWPLAAITDRL